MNKSSTMYVKHIAIAMSACVRIQFEMVFGRVVKMAEKKKKTSTYIYFCPSPGPGDGVLKFMRSMRTHTTKMCLTRLRSCLASGYYHHKSNPI